MKKVKPGDPLRIPAPTYNAFIDTARAFQMGQFPFERGKHRHSFDPNVVLIRNETGADRRQCEVVGVEGPIVTRKENEEEFGRRVMLRGVLAASRHVGRFAILLEPIPKAEIGHACIDGVFVVRVKMLDESHMFGDVSIGRADYLESGPTGSGQLLWIEPKKDRQTSEIAWTIVRLGGVSGGMGSLAVSYALITSKAGTLPPFRYAAEQATMNAEGVWSKVPDGLAYNNVFNLEEQGAGGQWVNPLLVGDAVVILPPPDPSVDAFVCTRSHYRGTY